MSQSVCLHKLSCSIADTWELRLTISILQVIRGWDEGVMKMSLGEAATLKCSYDYAYGERGFPPVIPPKAELIFEVFATSRITSCTHSKCIPPTRIRGRV